MLGFFFGINCIMLAVQIKSRCTFVFFLICSLFSISGFAFVYAFALFFLTGIHLFLVIFIKYFFVFGNLMFAYIIVNMKRLSISGALEKSLQRAQKTIKKTTNIYLKG